MQTVIDRIHEQLDELEVLAIKSETRNDSVSSWSVGQQIEHVTIAISGMAFALKRIRLASESQTPNQYKEIVLKSGVIPKGSVQAPEVSLPSADPDSKQVTRLLLKSRNRVRGLLELPREATIIHPILEEMNRDETLRFMVIHTDHHIEIIREILAEAT